MGNQRGFSAIGVVLALLVIGAIGGIGFYVLHSNQKAVNESKDLQTKTTQQKSLLTELKSDDSADYSWNMKLYLDGSGNVTYMASPSNTVPEPKDKEFSANTFDTSALRSALDSIDTTSYIADCNQNNVYSLTYKDKVLNDVECYITKNKEAYKLGSELNKIFNTAEL
jgi:Tfp pilus assembly protein PilV